MISKLNAYYRYHAHRYGHMRFEEPVVVLESDDWGKIGGKETAVYPIEFGKRTDWSYDQLESKLELERLYLLLESYQDSYSRPPVFTGNMIVSNPDFEATKASGYSEMILKPIDQNFPDLLLKWNEGIMRKVFYPQFHGRLHYNYSQYLSSLQTNEQARFLFEQGVNGGLENFVGKTLSYYSEYFNYETESAPPNLSDWIQKGLNQFESIFGYASASTVCPNYVLGNNSIDAFSNTSIKYLQASNKLFYINAGREKVNNYCIGTDLKNGLTALTRNHKFEPCRGKKEWEADFSISSVLDLIDRKIPVVLDTHRINYVGRHAEQSYEHLKKMLEILTEVKSIQFLTSVELGEAMANKGSFTDVFSGEKRQLTLLDNFFRKSVRQHLK